MRTTLKKLRIKKGLSQSMMAQKIGIETMAYYCVETNRRDGSFETWMAIKKIFKLKDDEILDLYHENKKVKKEATNGKQKTIN